jgi:uncharacterized membrane protein YhaH (DUF805 family)
MKWYLQALRKYAVFSGRARRREYWTFELLHWLIVAALIAIAGFSRRPGMAFLPVLYLLATAVPSLAGLVRRLHDTNRSGWWFFIGLIPLIGGLIILSFTLSKGNPGANRYGPDPKTETAGPEGPPVQAGTPMDEKMGYLAPPLDPRGR